MEVLLVRHSLAIDPEYEEEHRSLSRAGRERARRVAHLLAEREVSCDAVLTSPLVRAVQTAELLAYGMSYLGEIQVLPSLAPGYPPRIAAEQLSAYGTRVMVVGHEPSISALGALLSSRPSFPPFRPGQVCSLSRGEPAWLLNPESLSFEPLLLA